MLRNAKIIAFLATTNAKRCRKFYETVLGLPLVSDEAGIEPPPPVTAQVTVMPATGLLLASVTLTS